MRGDPHPSTVGMAEHWTDGNGQQFIRHLCSQPRAGDAAHHTGPRRLQGAAGAVGQGPCSDKRVGHPGSQEGVVPCLNNQGLWGPAGAPWLPRMSRPPRILGLHLQPPPGEGSPPKPWSEVSCWGDSYPQPGSSVCGGGLTLFS